MPMLLDVRGAALQVLSADPWHSPDGERLLAASDDAGAAMHLADSEAFSKDQHQGLWLAVDSEPSPPLPAVALIAIEFPAFNDGRGLSLAVLLRSRYGYRGELRAVGDTHPDLLHYMRRCGFDTVLLPEPHTLDSARAAFDPYSDYYQASVNNPEPAFRRMRRGV